MRAAWYERADAPTAPLHVGELEDLEPGPGDVRVRLAFSGVIHGDTRPPSSWGAEPSRAWTKSVPGQDGSGTIDRVGAGVARDRLGERVWVYEAAWNRQFGTSAELTVVPASQAVPMPDDIGFEQAACLGVPAMIAHRALFSDGGVQGKTVLVAGGGGAVGSMAIQMAKWGGARVLTTVASRAGVERARAIGADLAIDRTDADVAAVVLAATRGEGVHRVVELAFADNLATDVAVLARDGVLANYGAAKGDAALPIAALNAKGITLRFHLVYAMSPAAHAEAVRDIAVLLGLGLLKLHVSRRYPLHEIAAAHALQASGKADGKILIQIQGEPR